jgi:hypothetical protein
LHWGEQESPVGFADQNKKMLPFVSWASAGPEFMPELVKLWVEDRVPAVLVL